MIAAKSLLMKELKELFKTPFIYFLAGVFALLAGILFFNYLLAFKNNPQLDVHSGVLAPFYSNLNFILIFIAPLLSMKVFAKERDQGTISLLLLSNLNDMTIVLMKLFSLLVGSCFILLPTIACPIVLSLLGHANIGISTGSYLGLMFSMMAYLSVGVLFSTIFTSPITVAFTTFVVLMLSMFLLIMGSAIEHRMLGEIIKYISIPYHTEPFFRGAIRSFDVVYFISFSLGLTYLSGRIVSLKNNNF